jgi:hypothetical protein
MLTTTGGGAGGGAGGGVIVTGRRIDFVVSVSDVAVSVTTPLAGTTGGAVYTELAGFVEELAGLKLPHADKSQLAVQ